MANDKRFVVKNGLRAQNIDFRSPDELSNVLAEMLDDGTLTLSNSIDQLLSVNVDGTVSLSPNSGNVLIGNVVDNGIDKVQVEGTVSADNFVGDLRGSLFADDSTLLVDGLTSTHYGTFIGSFFGEGGAAIEANVVGDLKGSVFADDSTLLVDGLSGTHYGTFIGSFFGEGGAAIEANVIGDLTGSVFADDSTLLVDGLSGTHYGTFVGTFVGEADGQSPNFEGDLKGSVFADDSSLLVDAINSKIILDNNTTDELPEGDTNQYYTKARVQRDSRIISLIFGS